ncbi:hypothetical protein BKA66DRAFT_529359 [Pyrenochaeta sp. MPI-SDFR-AT-0127]|nr:hypothetical protein BKA66DRAFT_529359 [Pyrenochaeta sp. MPI-SDFR-AT-0127]
MRFILPIAALLPAALAWNPKLCNGAGGCEQTTWSPEYPFRCPDGTRLNSQQTASNSLAAGRGEYSVISKAEFPTSCLRGVSPQASDKLLVRTTQFEQKMYLFMSETCTETNPEEDCYLQNPNPAKTTICQIVDKTGKDCAMFKGAGECERWGYDINSRPQCLGWTPDKVETPTPY